MCQHRRTFNRLFKLGVNSIQRSGYFLDAAPIRRFTCGNPFMGLTAFLEEKKNQKETKNSKYKKLISIISVNTIMLIIPIITIFTVITGHIKTRSLKPIRLKRL